MHQKKLLKILVIFVVVIISSLSVFFIINENELSMVSIRTNEEKLVTGPLKSFSLTLEDLSEGYELTDENSLSVEDEEVYHVIFDYFGKELDFSNITLQLYRFDKIEQASEFQDGLKTYDYLKFNNITKITRQIGTEGYIVTINTSDNNAEGSSFSPEILTRVSFRISNIYCFVSWDQSDNFDYLFDLAKIVEQRIYNSII